MGLADYGRALVRGWWMLTVGLILGGLAAWGVLQTVTPLYQSNTQLLVSTPATTDPGAALQGSQFSQLRTATYAQLLIGRDLAASVVDDLGLTVTPGEVQSEITATVVPTTTLIDVTVTDPSPQRAFAIAQSVGRQFSATVDRLEATSTPGASAIKVSTVAQPLLPEEPTSPDPLLYLMAGCFAGLVVGGAGAVIRDRLDTRVGNEQVAADAAGVPVLGVLPDDPHMHSGALVQPGSPTAEAIRIVRSNLQFVSVGASARVLMVTSAREEEGKTTTAIRLAQALSESGLRVLLIEADLRRPRVTRYLGLVGGIGVTNLLTDTAEIDDVLQPVGHATGLTVLGAGPLPPNPSELLASRAMADLLDSLAARFDVLVVDAPPMLPVADGVGLAGLTDGVLLCVRWGKTDRSHVARARVTVERTGTRLLGVVLTFAPARTRGDYDYGYREDSARRGWLRRLLRRGGQPEPRLTAAPAPERLRPAIRHGRAALRGETWLERSPFEAPGAPEDRRTPPGAQPPAVGPHPADQPAAQGDTAAGEEEPASLGDTGSAAVRPLRSGPARVDRGDGAAGQSGRARRVQRREGGAPDRD